MLKVILIPIDFRVESLNTLKHAMAKSTPAQVHAILVYPYTLSGSVTEMLFYSQPKIIRQLLTPEFEQALSIIKNRFEKNLAKVSLQLFHGDNNSAFDLMLQAKGVNEIYVPANYPLCINDNSFNLLPFIERCPLPVNPVQWNRNFIPFTGDKLGPIFSN